MNVDHSDQKEDGDWEYVPYDTNSVVESKIGRRQVIGQPKGCFGTYIGSYNKAKLFHLISEVTDKCVQNIISLVKEPGGEDATDTQNKMVKMNFFVPV